MHWLIWLTIGTFINTFIIISIADVILMGSFQLKFVKENKESSFMITKENRIDIQTGNACAGYSIAYVLRHYGIPVNGEEIYADFSSQYPRCKQRNIDPRGIHQIAHASMATFLIARGNKMNDGCVYPKEVKKMLEKYGVHVKYCAGNLHALRNEVSKGTPVIVFMKVRKNKNWLHFVPIVGYDENNIYMAESLTELVNCNENAYNRKICNADFKILWSTSMLKMPLYTHTFFSIY